MRSFLLDKIARFFRACGLEAEPILTDMPDHGKKCLAGPAEAPRRLQGLDNNGGLAVG
jgi:hypothetical protein